MIEAGPAGAPLWTGEALVQAMGGRPVGALPAAVSGISIDTRTLQPGDVFFAITGDRTDGHRFVTAAAAAGASLLVVAEGKLAAMGRVTVPMIVVPDVLKALAAAGVAARARTKAKVVAVTGSAGKTTTKEALRRALGASGTVHAADKSFNNHWGVPLTLARLPEDADFAVFEIGMNHANEIRPLTGLVRPHVAIVTLIAAAHLGHFSSLDEIADAKAEIFEGLDRGGAALVNRDDVRWERLAQAVRAAGVERVLGFGEHEAADYRLVSCALEADHSTARVDVAGEELTLRIGAPGRHIVQNALAVLGAAHLVGADVTRAAEALASFGAEKGRGARHVLRHSGAPVTLIDESYNANPASVRAALALLAATPVGQGGRRIAVLGDMLELGSHSAALHGELAEPVAVADLALLVGPEMRALADALPGGFPVKHRMTVDEMEPVLLETVGPGDAVMVKSSNGIGSSRLVESLVRRFGTSATQEA
ncbi:MAG TPA: UDP-N-acetylmuramoylalanyl-D-glutamyl-2,6-diaminopimelate--D-alanyl-D-alanine ligase [Mesorhizobium sp.]|nr:UDP-N-acetylmuramoylalanyl-D-glutamyl-2,6-diaminopimelate--D-alanyl-D-alanine ligase [Mesorhizobium sp.]